jgi:hypothetical protein
LGLVHLKYLDESGCYGHCPTGYGYAALLATKTHQAIATAPAASQYLGSDEWLHLKRDELNCQVFADEYDLAMAIADGLVSWAVRCPYAVERFRFN